VTAPLQPVPVVVLGRPRPGVRTRNSAFKMVLLGCIAIGVVALAVLLVYIVTKGAPRLNPDLIQRFPSSLPGRAGARSAIVGTIWDI
jgi:phosphate transport system permease protein